MQINCFSKVVVKNKKIVYVITLLPRKIFNKIFYLCNPILLAPYMTAKFWVSFELLNFTSFATAAGKRIFLLSLIMNMRYRRDHIILLVFVEYSCIIYCSV